MATLANLIVRLSADTSNYQASLKAAQKSLNTWGRQMEGTGIALTKTLTVPIVATVGGVAAMTKSAASSGEQLFKLTQKTGVSVERLSAYRLATKLADITMDDFAHGVGKLSKKMFDVQTGSKEARTGFDTLGVSVFDSKGKLRASEEVMLAIADKFSKMQDGAMKTALAIEIFGKSGVGLIPFLDQGSQGIVKATEESKKLGMEWSTKTAKAAEEFNDNIKRLTSGIGAMAERLGKVGITAFGADLEKLAKGLEGSKTTDKLVNSFSGLTGAFAGLSVSTKLGIIGALAFGATLGPLVFITGELTRNLKEVIGLMIGMRVLAGGGLAAGAGVLAGAKVATMGGRLRDAAGRFIKPGIAATLGMLGVPILAGAGAGIGGFLAGKKLLGEPLAESLFPTATTGSRPVGVGETVGPGIRIPRTETIAPVSEREKVFADAQKETNSLLEKLISTITSGRETTILVPQ